MADQPTTIFTLGATADQIRSIVEEIQADRTAFIAAQNQIISDVEKVSAAQKTNASAVAEILPRLDALDKKLSGLISGVDSRIDTLEVNIANLVALVEAAIHDLAGVSTAELQQRQIDLLNKILQGFSPNLPVSIDLDLTRKTTASQTTPTKAGP